MGLVRKRWAKPVNPGQIARLFVRIDKRQNMMADEIIRLKSQVRILRIRISELESHTREWSGIAITETPP